MPIDLETKKQPFPSLVATTRQRRLIETTLGELVVAVTEEVMPFVREPSALYPVVSYNVNDVVARHRLRIHERSPEKFPSRLARALH